MKEEQRLDNYSIRIREIEKKIVALETKQEDIFVAVEDHIPNQIKEIHTNLDNLREKISNQPTWKIVSLMSMLIGILLTILGLFLQKSFW